MNDAFVIDDDGRVCRSSDNVWNVHKGGNFTLYVSIYTSFVSPVLTNGIGLVVFDSFDADGSGSIDEVKHVL